METKTFFRLMLFFACSIVGAWAAPKVSATISSPTISIGESVDLEINIEGSVRAEQPMVPTLEGLEFRGSNQSNPMSIVGSEVTQRVTYTFRFVARKEGRISIPQIDVNIGGVAMKTQPLTLTVKAGSPTQGAGDVAFAVLEPLKKTAFVGEDIGVEIRVYLDNSGSVRWQNADKPKFTADGFNTRDILPGRQSEQELNGKRYVIVTSRTVVTPTKAGKLALKDTKIRALYSRARRNPYDPFGGFGRLEELEVSAPAVEMEIKPLPIEGRPKDFAGAIGQFRFSATGTPAKVKIGEPIAMSLIIEGQGNFDRITTPPLAEPDGWNAYDSEDSFNASDDLRITGTKTFKLPMSPLAQKATLPVFAFTYFDPSAEKYITLKNEASPLVVEGAPVPLPIPTALPPPPEVKPDILPNLPTAGPISILRPSLTPSLLFGAILAPLPLLLGLLAWRSRKADPLAVPLATLNRERSRLVAQLKHSVDRAELFQILGRILQIDTAIARRELSAGFDDSQILASRELDETSEAAIRSLLSARSELLFAGGGRGETVTATERDRVLEWLAAWERCSPTRKGNSRAAAAVHALLWLVFAATAQAGDFESGNAAFAENKFDDARRSYERALSAGWQPGVLFNLGNTHFRLEKPGEAVLSYERVLALAPGHAEAAANLKFVRKQSGGKIAEPTWYEAALSVIPPRVYPVLAIGLAWIGWSWAASALWRRTGATGVASGTLLVLMGAGLGTALLWQSERNANDAIVLEQTDARREPSDRAPLASALAPGSRVRIVSEQGEWIFATLPDGQKSWLKTGTLERIIPPNHR